MELDKIIVNTTSQEGQSIQTTANLGDVNFSSVLQEVPQIQTTIQDNVATISSVINAPWVNVTSVNGMTGDIIVEPEILDFETNHYYPKNTLISHSGNLYWAKQNFTSSSSFNRSDWNQIEATGVSDWEDIQNKPNFATVAISGSYTDLSNTPSLADVAFSGEYSDLLHTPSLSQVATSGSYNDLSNTPTLATVAFSGQYGDLLNKPTNLSQFTNDINFLRGVNSQDITPITSVISASMIQNDAISTIKIEDNAITTAKIGDNAITTPKIKNNAVTTDKIVNNAITASKIDFDSLDDEFPIYYGNTSNNNINSDTWYGQYSYTVEYDGVYFIEFSQEMTNGSNSNDLSVRITKDNTEIMVGSSGGSSWVNYLQAITMAIVKCKEGEIIRLQSRGGGTGVFATRQGRYVIARIR